MAIFILEGGDAVLVDEVSKVSSAPDVSAEMDCLRLDGLQLIEGAKVTGILQDDQHRDEHLVKLGQVGNNTPF